jgi:hypothetical protein
VPEPRLDPVRVVAAVVDHRAGGDVAGLEVEEHLGQLVDGQPVAAGVGLELAQGPVGAEDVDQGAEPLGAFRVRERLGGLLVSVPVEHRPGPFAALESVHGCSPCAHANPRMLTLLT